MKWGAIGLALAAMLASSAAAAKGAAPLFAADTPIDVTITGPVNDIARKAARVTDPQPATLSANGETLPITLAARGITRRNNCEFPPLMVDFVDKPGDASLFDKQNRLKLVTHCKRTTGFDRFALREYAAYKLYNVLTPKSLEVRLARVRYVDDGKEVAQRWGFFIEDIDDLAKRMKGKELEVGAVVNTALDPADSARYVLFQYMIGNLDWDMSRGPPNTMCCHNSKLIGATAETLEGLTPVAYDFDYSGIVGAPYAQPPVGIPVPSVKVRYYRGLCRHNDAVRAAVPQFLAARPALEQALGSVTQLEAKDRDDMRKYMAGFFEAIATPAKVDKLLKGCRGAEAAS